MNLIENKDNLHFFVQSNPNIRLLIPVWSSPKAHEFGTHLSFVYYRTETDDGIINFNHVDASTLPNFSIHKLCNENTLVLGNRYIGSKGLDYEWVYLEEYGKSFIFNEKAARIGQCVAALAHDEVLLTTLAILGLVRVHAVVVVDK
jgi:hypothetical protein